MNPDTNSSTSIESNDPFSKPYDSKETESRIYQTWEKSGFFNPDKLPARHQTPYTIIMPPPNANGHLHAGHALFITLEDILIRYKRMQGFKTLWVPGADHAGFETQIVYEKKLEKEGRSRFKMDPKELYKEIYDFTIENKKNMEQEVRAIGASCDWSREKFTLDADVVSDVQKTFKKMYDDNLIYRGMRMANWCTKHQTSLSDVETESREKKDILYFIQYGPLVVATVRPETIFGDVAVAVHPEDPRYKALIGTDIEVKIPNGRASEGARPEIRTLTLKVIGDAAVEPEFGTGALKITPSHDKNDFEMAMRHNLPHIEVIDKIGKLNDKAGAYAGLKIVEARKRVSEDLEALGLIVKKEDYLHSVPVCYKCETTIEHREMPQWFVKMKPLADMAAKAVDEGKIAFYPDNFRKVFLHWMNNPMDWNISRQIVWGIPIPAKICAKCGTGFPDLDNSVTACVSCGANELVQDTDTFDTWFSSGQWPLVTLGFPDSSDFKTFYPTDVMETGYDLVFKWVPRMVIFGLYLANKVPFHTVYMHGLVNDAQGKKMSKSKGNVVNPKDLTDKYGTDALRMALVVANPPGSDTSLAENKVKGYRNFGNKIWNATRFVLNATADLSPEIRDGKAPTLRPEDQKAVDEFNTVLADVTKDLDGYRIHLASEKLYHYFWHTFADVLIEERKKIILDEKNISAQWTLRHILMQSLKALHPFMPFLTEEIWRLIGQKELLMIEKWPK